VLIHKYTLALFSFWFVEKMRSTRFIIIIEAHCVDCLPSVTYACVPSSSFESGAVVFVFVFLYFSSLRHVRWFTAFTTSTDVLFFFLA
jgi:hypothetical protein